MTCIVFVADLGSSADFCGRGPGVDDGVMVVVGDDDVVVLPATRVSVPKRLLYFFLSFCARGSDWVCLCGPLCHLLLGVSPLFYRCAPSKKNPATAKSGPQIIHPITWRSVYTNMATCCILIFIVTSERVRCTEHARNKKKKWLLACSI